MNSIAHAGVEPDVPPAHPAAIDYGTQPSVHRSGEWKNSAADFFPRRRDEKRAVLASAALLATASGAGAGSAMAEIVTVTTTQSYATAMSSVDTTASFDVLFTPVENATDLVSISDGSVFTGEGAILTIEAIASDDTTVTLFDTNGYMDFFQTNTLFEITNNTFTDFSARDIKGLRFTLEQDSPPPKPSLTLPVGTQFVFSVVPEPAAGALLACGLAVVVIGRQVRRLLSVPAAR